MKKFLSFTTALAISFGCLTACGSSSDSSEESTTAPTQTTAEPTQAITTIATTTTTESITTTATEPIYDFDLKYTSLSSNSFGDPEEFIEFLRCKLKLILGNDELIVENVEEYELQGYLTYDYSCSFTSKYDNLPVSLTLTSSEDCGLWKVRIETRTQSIKQQLFQYKNSVEYNEHLCEAIIPLAVLYNCSSKEELLSIYEDKWTYQKGYNRDNGEKFKVYNTKIKTDELYGELDYSTGVCISFFEPLDFHYEDSYFNF